MSFIQPHLPGDSKEVRLRETGVSPIGLRCGDLRCPSNDLVELFSGETPTWFRHALALSTSDRIRGRWITYLNQTFGPPSVAFRDEWITPRRRVLKVQDEPAAPGDKRRA
jgi:hypothetical protein